MEITIVLLCILLSGLSAAFASALNSVSVSFVQTQEEINPVQSARLREYREHSGAGTAPYQIADMIILATASVAACHWAVYTFGTWWMALVSGGTSFILVAFSRTIFTAVGERLSERLALPGTAIARLIDVVAKPLTYLLKVLSRSMSRPASEDDVREEIDALVDSAVKEGTLDTDEYKLLKNIMGFSEVLVTDVMTPRTVVFYVDASESIAEALARPETNMYSRFPVGETESIDTVCGYVLSRDLLRTALAGGGSNPLREVMREVHYVPENISLERVLEQFLRRREKLFVVVDEYGGVEGIITLEDVIESILGQEIIDEADRIIDLRALAKQRRDRRIEENPARLGQTELSMSESEPE